MGVPYNNNWMNGREMRRQGSPKQTFAQTQPKQPKKRMIKSADNRYPGSKSSSSSDGNNAIGNID